MKRFLMGYLLGSSISVSVGAVLVTVLIFPPLESIQNAGQIAVMSFLAGLILSCIFYEVEQHSQARLSNCVAGTPSKRWFWLGIGMGFANAVLIMGTVLVSMVVVKQIPAWKEIEVRIVAIVGFLSMLLYAVMMHGIIVSRLSGKTGMSGTGTGQ